MAAVLLLLLAASTQASTCERPPAAVANDRGLAQLFAGDFAKTIAAFDEALKHDAISSRRLNRGIAFLRAGQTAKAIADFEALANDEHLLFARMPRITSRSHRSHRRAADAETRLDRAIVDNDLDDAALPSPARCRGSQRRGPRDLDYLKKHPTRRRPAALRVSAEVRRIDAAKTYLRRVIASAAEVGGGDRGEEVPGDVGVSACCD
jgi:tetratricopeptide (TPR) repeat protein